MLGEFELIIERIVLEIACGAHWDIYMGAHWDIYMRHIGTFTWGHIGTSSNVPNEFTLIMLV